MRREDVLMALLVRHVKPWEGEQDWQLIASVFYTLTGLLMPATRVEQRYYELLHLHGSRAALETAADPVVAELSSELRRRATSRNGESCAAVSAAATIPPAVAPRSRPPPPVTADLAPIPEGAGGTVASLFLASPVRGRDEAEKGSAFPGDEPREGLTPEQRQRWRRLRQDPISPEVLLALLQRFTLVEGSAVFLAPVHPSTVMEFNGIRSGPYDTVVMFPLSLMGIKQRILASRRDYELRRRQSQTPAAATAAYFLPGNEEIVNPRKRGRAAAASTADAAVSNNKSDSGTAESTGGSNAHASDDANMGAILNLQDLERAVWQITANCVVFNAPESYYPSTARQFANACVEIIDQYCMQRLFAA